MIEPTELLVNNLLETFRQINTYLAIGLTASVSALAVDQANSRENKLVEVKGFVTMAPEPAKFVLMGITLVVGLMGGYAAQSAGGIVRMLQGSPDVLRAACTYSSVGTSPIGVRILAASLPIIFIGVIWLQKRHRNSGAYTMFFFFLSIYGVMGLMLARIACRAP